MTRNNVKYSVDQRYFFRDYECYVFLDIVQAGFHAEN